MKASNMLIGLFTITIGTALMVEGVRSIYERVDSVDIINRLDNIEKIQLELTEKQNYLYELLTDTSYPVTGYSAIRVERTQRTVDHEELDLFCLAKNIFHEAGVEDELGMFAVAQVTINRVRNVRYPNTICEVVMQPYQFSWANDRSRRWTHPSGPKWDMSKRIARQVIKEGYRVPALQAAVYYHADYVSPRWRDPNAVIAQVGTHIFYTSAR